MSYILAQRTDGLGSRINAIIWYKGGYLIFYFKELPRLKSEFKNKRTNGI